jgi:MoaA/NifB/PqqE/SkfB family radical SAM enzyme
MLIERIRKKNVWETRFHTKPHMTLADFGIESIFVEVTNICNMHCKFCPSDHIQRERKFMDYGLFKKVITQLSDLVPVYPIALHELGEPLLHKDLFKFIDYCATKKIKIFLFTNGAKLLENISEICNRDNIEALIISIQTPTLETYALRGSSKPFKKYMDDIYHAIDYFMSHQSTKMRIEIHLAETTGLPFRDWDILTNKKEALDIVKDMCRRISHSEEEFDDIPENFLDLPEWEYWGYPLIIDSHTIHIRIKHFGTFGAHESSIPKNVEIVERTVPISCSMAKNNLVIQADGTISMCCLDTEGYLNLGNIKNNTILEALTSEKRYEFINDVTKSKLCRRCLGTFKLKDI